VSRSDDCTGAGKEQHITFIHYNQPGSQMTEHFIAPPLLSQFNCSTLQIAVVLVQICFKFLKQRKSICHTACKTCYNLVVKEPADFFSCMLHHNLIAECYLAVACNRHFVIMSDREYRRHSCHIFLLLGCAFK